MNIDVIGCGAIGAPLVELLANQYPKINIRAIDTNSDTLSKLNKFSNVKTVCSDDITQLTLAKTIICCANWQTTTQIAEQLAADKTYRVLISISRPTNEIDIEILKAKIANNILLILSCGLEPGLSEILAFYLLDDIEQLQKLTIKCGGIVTPRPNNIFGYKRLFGTLHLPFAAKDAFYIRNGNLVTAPRFSAVTTAEYPNIGILEDWHDGLQPRLIKHPKLSSYSANVEQRTIRWPGYSKAVRRLHETNILDETVSADKEQSNKRLFELITKDTFRLDEDDTSISLLKFQLHGINNGQAKQINLDLKFTDYNKNIHSMALATCLPVMFLLDNLSEYKGKTKGVYYPEEIITPNKVSRLFQFLKPFGVTVEHSQKNL